MYFASAFSAQASVILIIVSPPPTCLRNTWTPYFLLPNKWQLFLLPASRFPHWLVICYNRGVDHSTITSTWTNFALGRDYYYFSPTPPTHPFNSQNQINIFHHNTKQRSSNNNKINTTINSKTLDQLKLKMATSVKNSHRIWLDNTLNIFIWACFIPFLGQFWQFLFDPHKVDENPPLKILEMFCTY